MSSNSLSRKGSRSKKNTASSSLGHGNSAFSQLDSPEESCYMHIPTSKVSLFLEKRVKTVHFIRHAEGVHNEVNRKAGNNSPTIFSTPGSMQYWDAPLTKRGTEQCLKVRDELEAEFKDPSSRSKHIELVVVSPLTRTLQTAELIFGKADCEGAPPFLVHPLVRERTGYYTCDGRRKISEIQPEFPPCIDFSLCTVDQDNQWTEVRESDEDCTNRGIQFLQWIAQRPEKEIAVVTHSSWLRHLFAEFGGNVVEEDQEALQRLAGNAELRSVALCSHDNPHRAFS